MRPAGGAAELARLDGARRAQPVSRRSTRPARQRRTTARRAEPARPGPELFASLPATGAHEVIVNGPQPVLSLAELPLEQVIAAVEVWRERMRAHARAPTCS